MSAQRSSEAPQRLRNRLQRTTVDTHRPKVKVLSSWPTRSAVPGHVHRCGKRLTLQTDVAGSVCADESGDKRLGMQHAAWSLGGAMGGHEGGGGSLRLRLRRYVVPFIRAISDTSPTRRLNVTFLPATMIKDAASRRGWQTAAYNIRNCGIRVMLAGSIPVRRFSPSNLRDRHRCGAEAARADRAWPTYR
jgi:hypothetical protein